MNDNERVLQVTPLTYQQKQAVLHRDLIIEARYKATEISEMYELNNKLLRINKELGI